MKKAFLVLALIVLGQTTIDSRLPDAIRCGADGSDFEGAIYFIHNYKAWKTKTIHYYQILTLEHRWVYFNEDGGYNAGGGDYITRKGCQNKSLATLDKEGRTIYYALDPYMYKNQTKIDEENVIKNSIAKLKEQSTAKDKKIVSLEEEVSELKKRQQSSCANFWDYEQIKQSWMKEFRREILAEIKEKGLQIGSRWKLQQEQTAFVVRDVEGSRKKDSRFSFAEETYSNLK